MARPPKESGPLQRLDGLSDAELRQLVSAAQVRLRADQGEPDRPVLTVRNIDADGVVLQTPGGGEAKLPKGGRMALEATAMSLPETPQETQLAAKAFAVVVRSLVFGSVTCSGAGRLELDLDGLRRNGARFGVPQAVLLDAKIAKRKTRAPSWRLTLNSPASLNVAPGSAAVFVVVGVGPLLDADAVGRTVFRTPTEASS